MNVIVWCDCGCNINRLCVCSKDCRKHPTKQELEGQQVTFIVTTIENGETMGVVAEGSDLAETVQRALDLGYTTGTIYNQMNGASRDLAEWVAENQGRLGAYRLAMEETE